MSRLKLVRFLPSLAVLFCLTSPAPAQEFAAANARPVITATTIQEDAAHRIGLPMHEVSELAAAKDLGPAPASLPMDLQLQLQRSPQQDAALDAYIVASQRPGSPRFGQTITPAEFARRFGMAQQDLDAISGWLASKGFEVRGVDNGRLAITFHGNAAQVEDAFHTEIHLFAGSDGEQHYAAVDQPEAPRALRRALSYLNGLQNFVPMPLANFDGPVTDFALGNERATVMPAETSAAAMTLHLAGGPLHDASFTASKGSAMVRDGAILLNVRTGGDSHAPTGSLVISSEEDGTIAVIHDIAACEPYNGGYGRSCTVAFHPATSGEHAIHAIYSGDDFTRAIEQNVIVHISQGNGVTVQSGQINPESYFCGGTADTYAACTTAATANESGTISYSLFWQTYNSGTTAVAAAGATQPTGSVIFGLGSNYLPGTIVLPAAGQTTSSGTCTSQTSGSSPTTIGSCSYACTYVASQQVINCTLTNTAFNYIFAASAAAIKITVSYSGDANYAANATSYASSTKLTESYIGDYGSSSFAACQPNKTVASLVPSPSFTSYTGSTYGTAGTTPAYNVIFTPTSGTSSAYGGSSTQALFQIVGPSQFGTVVLDDLLTGACEGTATLCPIAAGTYSPLVTPGTYTLQLEYGGNYFENGATCTASNTGYAASNSYAVNGTAVPNTNFSATITIALAQPTIAMATPTSGTPTTQVYGSTTPFNVTGTLGWPGSGVPPTPSDVTFSSTAAGTFAAATCGSLTSPATCTAVFTPAGTSNAGSYNFSASYTGDINYLSTAASTISSDYKITAATPTLGTVGFSPASSEPYGTSQAITLSDTLTFSGAPPNGAVTFTVAGTNYAASCGTTSPATCTYTVPAATVAALPVGNYSVTASIAAAGNYNSASGTSATFSITQATTSLVLSDTAAGTTTAGVTSTTITATSNLNVSGITVTFQDTTTGATLGTATTNSSGVATLAITTATAGVSGGLNNITASITGTANYTAVTSSKSVIYLQGILFSLVGTHNFSGLITDGGMQVEGTLDGTTVSAYGVGVYNFTASSQTLPVTLTNSASKAFTLANSCGNTPSAGELCTLVFNYAPPYGDGCTVGTGGTCTKDGSGYPQGTFESATWTYGLPSGTIAGLGNSGFSTSGVAATTGTLEGKAIQATQTLTVSPTAAAFGNVAQGAASNTITIAVTNSNAQPVSFSYAGPTTSNFTASNSCSSPIAANASCNIYVTLVTTSTGTFSDSIVLTPSGGAATTVSLSGTAAASTTGITLTSTGHNFGSITDGTSVSFGVTLTNNTTGTATVGFSNTPGTGFTVVNGCGATLAANASCNYTFTFAPTMTGAVTDTLVVSSNVPLLPGGTGSGPSYSDTVTVTGTGVAGGQLTATSVKHNFGTLAAGTSGGNYGVELTNNTSSSVTLIFSGLTNTADGFSLVGSSCGATLAVNANCELVFTFSPATTGLGTVSAVYPITASAALNSGGSMVSPAQITLVGTGQ